MKIGYCRVSTKEQCLNGNALLQQIDRIKQTNVEKIYLDIESGLKDNRKEYKAVIEGVKKGLIKEIVVTRMDRITRSLRTQLDFISLIQEHKIKLTVLDQAVDFETAAGKLSLNMLGAIAQNYSDTLSERIKQGYEYHRKLKKTIRPLLGYKKNNDRLELDTDPFFCTIFDKKEYSRYDLVRFMIQVYLDTKSFQNCNDYLVNFFGVTQFSHTNPHHKSLRFSLKGINYILNHPILRGHLVYFYEDKTRPTEYHLDNHPAIITDLEYTQIIEREAINQQIKGYGAVSNNIYTGLIFCANCKYPMTLTQRNSNTKKKYIYYRCPYHSPNTCQDKKFISLDIIHKAFFSVLKTEQQRLLDSTDNIESTQVFFNASENPLEFLQSKYDNILRLENIKYLKSLKLPADLDDFIQPQAKQIAQKLVSKILISNRTVSEILLKIH